MATVNFSMTGDVPVELPLRQFGADEYMAMVDAGVFDQRCRVELIEGYIVDMAPAGPEHNYVIMRFPRLFAALMADFELWIQGTLGVDRRNVFDPDFMLLRPRKLSYKKALPGPADIALIVEVAGSSLRRDAGVKLPIYANHGIEDFWIADLDREVLVVHRKPQEGAYLDKQEFSGDSLIAPLAAPEFQIAVRAIFD
jgi:Uma2 family endonuclease